MLVHMAVARAFLSRPADSFRPTAPLFRERAWERGGAIYRRLLVHRWKRFLPDAAPWFRGGRAKSDLIRRTPDDLRRFVQETCRSEATHLTVIAGSPLFFLFNRVDVGLGMLIVGFLFNAPCLVAQRFNRLRVRRGINRR
jgi:glycosyl-4,4'-diaponeurosporenoate acyltransferase